MLGGNIGTEHCFERKHFKVCWSFDVTITGRPSLSESLRANHLFLPLGGNCPSVTVSDSKAMVTPRPFQVDFPAISIRCFSRSTASLSALQSYNLNFLPALFSTSKSHVTKQWVLKCQLVHSKQTPKYTIYSAYFATTNGVDCLRAPTVVFIATLGARLSPTFNPYVAHFIVLGKMSTIDT